MAIINDLIAYVFTPFPGRNFSYYAVVIIIIVVLLGLSFYIRIRTKRKKDDKAFKKIIRPICSKLELLAIGLIVYLVVRYYGVAFISMRFLLYVMLALVLLVLYILIKKYRKEYPALKKHREQQIEKNKYIPRKRKR